MMRYPRLWRQFVLNATVREAEYRVNLLLSVFEGVAQVVLAILTLLLLYRFTPRVAGWSIADVLVLVGIYRVVDGIISLQLAPNMLAIGPAIRRGDMDFLLLRPVSTQFLVSLRLLEMPEAVNVLIGLGLTIYAVHLAGVRPSLGGVLAAGFFCTCGILLLYALWFTTVVLAFWLIQTNNVDELFMVAFEAGRYPVGFFRGVVRAVLTFVIPVAFATTFPAQALLGSIDPRYLVGGVVLAGIGLLWTHLFWGIAVRHYGSASS